MQPFFIGAIFAHIASGLTPVLVDAGWSSPVARQAHNLKVVGSNPTPATNLINDLAASLGGFVFFIAAPLPQ